jgi:hypothetical protein
VYVGAGVLAWTSVKMMTSEPLVAGPLASEPLVLAVFYIAVVGGVLGAGFVRNHRTLESRIPRVSPNSRATMRRPAPNPTKRGGYRPC